MSSLKKLNAVVTGSTSGIGLGIAHELAKQGANIVLNGFGDEKTITNIIEEIQKHGVTCMHVAADLSQADECQKLIEEAQDKMGGVDILINNAGIQHVEMIENFPDEKWNAIIAINLSACFHTIKHAMPAMKEKNFGRIINIASAHGLVASPNKAGYVAAKHGVVGLTKVVAQEAADYNITANAICPGWVDTPLVRQQIEARANKNGTSVDEEAKKLLSEKQPKTEFTTPEDIGRLAVFLANPENKTMTGAPISIDGGWTCQ